MGLMRFKTRPIIRINKSVAYEKIKKDGGLPDGELVSRGRTDFVLYVDIEKNCFGPILKQKRVKKQDNLLKNEST